MTPSPQPFSLPADLQKALQRALEYRKGGRPDEVMALVRLTLTQYPQHPVLLGQLGELLMQQGDFKAALPLLEQAKQGAPGYAPHWLMLTQCLLQLDRAKEAKKTITEAIGKGLRHPLADALLKQARSSKKQKPVQPMPLNEALRQIETLFQAGRYAEVEQLGGELQSRHPRVPRIGYPAQFGSTCTGPAAGGTKAAPARFEARPRHGPGTIQSRLCAGRNGPFGRGIAGVSEGYGHRAAIG